MVVSAEVIRSKEVFHIAWLLGTGDSRKLSRRDLLEEDLPKLCESIIEMVPEKDVSSAKKTGLYILSLLTFGTVQIHRAQVDFLQKDVERLKEFMRKKSFVLLFAEQFEKERALYKEESSRNKMRSEPIVCIEDIDNWVNLADLPLISEQLGINGNPRDLIMLDALPNLHSDWHCFNSDLNGLYGSVDGFVSSQSENTLHATFVEGNGSNERSRERREDAILVDVDDIILPRASSKRKVADELAEVPTTTVIDNKQQATPLQMDNRKKEEKRQVQTQEDVQIEKEPDQPRKDNEEEMQFSKVFLVDSLQPDTLEQVEQDPLQQPHPVENNDLQEVPVHMQGRFMDYLDKIRNMSDESMPLPPIPQDLDFTAPPLAKKQKTTDMMELEEEEEQARERARKRASSRPITPLTPMNRTDLTNLNTTEKINENELSFEIDQYVKIPEKKRTRRNLPLFYGDDIEIDVAVQKSLLANYSSLVKTDKEDWMVKVPSKTDRIAKDMMNPAPIVSFGNKLSKEILTLYKSTVYCEEGRDNRDKSDDDKENQQNETIKFTSVCLLPSPLPNTVNETTPFLDENLSKQLQFEETERPYRIAEDLEEDIRYSQVRLNEPQEEIHEKMEYVRTCLFPTPEKRNEAQIIEDLQLEPLPIIEETTKNNLATGDGIEVVNEKEKIRRRQKSSLGINLGEVEELHEDTERYSRQLKELEQEEKIRKAREQSNDQDPFVFSSGSLLPHNRFFLHQQLLAKAKEEYPGKVNFHDFTAEYTCKEAATSFEGLLVGLKNMQLTAEQREPYGPIFIQHVAH